MTVTYLCQLCAQCGHKMGNGEVQTTVVLDPPLGGPEENRQSKSLLASPVLTMNTLRHRSIGSHTT